MNTSTIGFRPQTQCCSEPLFQREAKCNRKGFVLSSLVPKVKVYGTRQKLPIVDKSLGLVARSLVSANRWLRGIKRYRFPWYLTLVSINRASRNPGLVATAQASLEGGGGYSWEFLAGLCLTLYQTKKCYFPYLSSEQTSKIHTRFQTLPLGRNYVIIT